MAAGFILSQLGEDGKCYPSRFGSITWNDREQKYSQAKIKLYGLFRALCATRTFVIGLRNLTVEVDAKYIKGMINNLDVQPNATINRWIAGILLFNFTLQHVPRKDHSLADGLSRCPAAPGDPEEDNGDNWIDTAYSFAIVLLNACLPPLLVGCQGQLFPEEELHNHQLAMDANKTCALSALSVAVDTSSIP